MNNLPTPPADVVLMQQYSAGYTQGKLRGSQQLSQDINARHVSLYVGVAVFAVFMLALTAFLVHELLAARKGVSTVHKELLVLGGLEVNLSSRESIIAGREAQQEMKDREVHLNLADIQQLRALELEVAKCRAGYAAISDMMKNVMSESGKHDAEIRNEYTW
jgi:hypothetical protein